MDNYNPISYNLQEGTVMSCFESKKSRATSSQSEADLEYELIKTLCEEGYEKFVPSSHQDFIDNLRKCLSTLNDYSFTDNEWAFLMKTYIASEKDGIVEKTRKIQEDSFVSLNCEDGMARNIYLIKKNTRDTFKNTYQVMHQYSTASGERKTRYDVTILINGLPLVHIELKRRGIELKDAFAQISRYKKDSFWADEGLFEYVQLFVISNGTYTKYYSNTVNDQNMKKKGLATNNSFEFTSYWADAQNNIIIDLMDFAQTFLSFRNLFNIITKYCVFTSRNELMVMRPYQIAATECILNKIEVANSCGTWGTTKAGGVIWHATGSGKTLTSFKTASLAAKSDAVDCVFFVVDRQDLDKQTVEEYEKFKKGCVASNTSTAVLEKQISDSKSKIIVTTIQKLGVFTKKNKTHDIYGKKVVLIFDECHRSQFGSVHARILQRFKKCYIFGFTGTPIFEENSSSANVKTFSKSGIAMSSPNKTTEQLFGPFLHRYTLVDAINDGNILPFRIEYCNTIKAENEIADKQVSAIDKEKALLASERVSKIVKYIYDNYDRVTKSRSEYETKIKNRVNGSSIAKNIKGFNSLFAVSSIPAAMVYYNEFKKQNALSERKLKVATIFSFSDNEVFDGEIGEETFSIDGLDKSSRDFLDLAMKDYNEMFGTSFDTSASKDGFNSYYVDISSRMKNKELDLLIVVNMFLTGFDAPVLNTLWVDKNLKQHGLLQAFSRTNRIINKSKTNGNIVCFRDLRRNIDEAILLFSNTNNKGVICLRGYDDYYYGYTEGGKNIPGYKNLIESLVSSDFFGKRILTNKDKKAFIQLFGQILKSRNILSSFSEFSGNEIVSDRAMQDYQSHYIMFYDEFKFIKNSDKEYINNDVCFEVELVKQVYEINIDYILNLINKHSGENHPSPDPVFEEEISHLASSSFALKSKKGLIQEFINSLTVKGNVINEWSDFVTQKRTEELDKIIIDYSLDKSKTYSYIKDCFARGELITSGGMIDGLLPHRSLFTKDSHNKIAESKAVEEVLLDYFEKYVDIQ